MPTATKTTPRLPSVIVALARKEIGVEEINGSNCGPRVNEYKAATWLDPKKSWAWCAAFVCWLVLQALQASGIKQTKTFKRPRTAGAWDFRNWSLAQDNSVRTVDRPGPADIAPGDILIYTFSHIGVASSTCDADGYCRAIEGNTDDGGDRDGGAVLEMKRHYSKVKSRLRFTI